MAIESSTAALRSAEVNFLPAAVRRVPTGAGALTLVPAIMSGPVSSGFALPVHAAVRPKATRRTAAIVHRADGERIRDGGGETLRKLTPEQTGGMLALGLAEVPPGGGAPPHVHDTEDEMFLVIEGEYRVFLAGEWTDVGPGGVVYLPRGCEHGFEVIGTLAGRHWTMTTSAG